MFTINDLLTCVAVFGGLVLIAKPIGEALGDFIMRMRGGF